MSALASSDAAGQARTVLSVPGMHCAGCMSKVERGLADLHEVSEARVNLSARTVSVVHSAELDARALVAALQGIGFEAQPRRDELAPRYSAAKPLLAPLAVAFFTWLSYFAGSQISSQAAQFPALVGEQIGRLFAWLQSRGFEISQADVGNYAGSLVSGVGTVTRAIGGIFGSLATLFLIVIIGIYVAFEPRLYERSVAWLLPSGTRKDFYVTASRMGATMRRLMAGRLVGMLFEGIFTWVMLFAYGVPMAALLGILTGLLAFVPNLGALIAGMLMVLVGFSGGTEMGLYTIFVYFLVQTFDGYVVIPLIAKKTVDLAPALVLASQLIMGILFGVLGLFLADPLMAMIKVWLERRAEINDRDNMQVSAADGA